MSNVAESRSPRICLVTFGSAGDVHPLLALGQGLRLRGRRVTIITNAAFARQVQDSGLDFEPVGAERQYQDTVNHPKLWHSIDGFGVMWRYLLRPALAPTYERIAELASRGPCVVIASPVAMGARLAQEHLGIPLISAYTAATMLRTTGDPMTIAHWRVPPWCPRRVRATAWDLLDRHKLEPLVRPALDALRKTLGLQPLDGSVFGKWMHSPEGGVALFPSWFAPAQPDWPSQVQQADFPLFDGDAPLPDPPGLEEFLCNGPPPVGFMPGTARQNGSGFYEAAVDACMTTRQRGLLLGTVPPAIVGQLPQHMFSVPYAAFARLLPRLRALVHHGGIGTAAQGLRAGIPQLVAPCAYDQFDNAMRLEFLGVGRSLGRGAGGLAQMGGQLAGLLASPAVAASCAKWALRTDPRRACEATSKMLEAFE
jgi:rhamnosyltransferase subunit B